MPSPFNCTTPQMRVEMLPVEVRLRTILLFACIPALGLSSCTDVTPSEAIFVRIEPTKAQYAPGDTVVVMISNVGTSVVGFNECAVTLQGFQDAWVSLSPTGNSGINCVDAIRGQLAPGDTSGGPAGLLPENLPPGTYRYRMDAIVTDQGELLPLASRLSGAFLVIKP
jgi:hypothetical protein